MTNSNQPLLVFVNDVVDDAVFLRLLRVHDEVALHVLLNFVELLAGVLGQDLVGNLAHAQNFAGVDVDVCRLAAEASH